MVDLKFPRTKHLPFSPGRGSDDKVHPDLSFVLDGKRLLLTTKMDGENQRWTRSSFNLRSLSSTSGGELRSRAKAKWGEVCYLIDEGLSVFVEDTTVVHSIQYGPRLTNLFVIAVRDDKTGHFMSWFDTEQYARKLNMKTVPVLWHMQGSEFIRVTLESLIKERHRSNHEGIVLRPEDEITNWTAQTAKWVRANHVQTDEHWERTALKNLRK
jgi:hypothetical protein